MDIATWTESDTLSNNIVHSLKSNCIKILLALSVSHSTQRHPTYTVLHFKAQQVAFHLLSPDRD